LERRLAEPERLRVKDRLAYWLAELPDLSGEAPRLVAERRGRLIRISFDRLFPTMPSAHGGVIWQHSRKIASDLIRRHLR
jgi:hypothetical protein